MSVEMVALKLPTFWTTCPSAWFAQTEAQFALRGITADETKYYHVVAVLDPDTASRSLAIISSPPPTCKYSTIKSFLTDAYGLSEAEKAVILLDIKELGDRKPSEVMDKMLALLGDHKPCFFFGIFFFACCQKRSGLHWLIPPTSPTTEPWQRRLITFITP